MNDHILVFDVNETLLDLSTLEPLFERVFGDSHVMRLWFAQVILYSESITLGGAYTPFSHLAKGTLRMVGQTEGKEVTDADCDELVHLITHMSAWPDVKPALTRLRDAEVRMVTLTNSDQSGDSAPIARAGIADYFEAHFSVDTLKKFKPHPDCYHMAAEKLGVDVSSLCLVATHLWDTIGAQGAGAQAAFLTRPGNAMLPADGVPRPNFFAKDLGDFADQWLAQHG